MGHAEHRRRLALRIGMQRVRLNVGGVLPDDVQDVNRLPDPADDKVAEERDVHVRDVMIGHSARTAVADVILRHQALLVERELGAVGRRDLGLACKWRRNLTLKWIYYFA